MNEYQRINRNGEIYVVRGLDFRWAKKERNSVGGEPRSIVRMTNLSSVMINLSGYVRRDPRKGTTNEINALESRERIRRKPVARQGIRSNPRVML